ncbi:MAG: hypothetical protein HC923_03640 [Myxococcales bacterium]|nr:hypothetical protein [Myxococcales bacterium]
MSLAKTALWGLLILMGALLLDWLLFVRIANAEPVRRYGSSRKRRTPSGPAVPR